MVYQAGAPPSFGLYPLSGNGHMVRIHIGKRAQCQIRITAQVKSRALARQPFQISMGSYMNDGIRLPDIPYPQVIGQVLMGRSDKRIMIDFGCIKTVAPGCLHRDKNMSIHNTGNQNAAFPIHHDTAGSTAPVLFHLRPDIVREGLKKVSILFSCHLMAGPLFRFRHHGQIIGGLAGDELNELAACFRDIIYPIAFRFHLFQKAAYTFYAVKAEGTSDIGILRRIVVKNNGNFLVFISLPVKPGPSTGLSCHGSYPFFQRQIFHLSCFLHMLGRYGHPVDNAVKFRHGNTDGHFHGIHAFL